jgi:hypothetical protein
VIYLLARADITRAESIRGMNADAVMRWISLKARVTERKIPVGSEDEKYRDALERLFGE